MAMEQAMVLVVQGMVMVPDLALDLAQALAVVLDSVLDLALDLVLVVLGLELESDQLAPTAHFPPTV